MGEIYHVDTNFLTNALGVFEDLPVFEALARSPNAVQRAANVARLVDALDLCNLLVLGDRIVYDTNVGGGRSQEILDRIDRVACTISDVAIADMFRDTFSGVAPADESMSWSLQREAARGATAFFPRLARCATNVLDLFHLPHTPPADPETHLLPYVESGRQPTENDIDRIRAMKGITGRRFYASLLSDETAFRALCNASQSLDLTKDVLAVLFMNFRLRLAEQRSLAKEKVLVRNDGTIRKLDDPLVYLPAMGRRDFSREFAQFVRWGHDPNTLMGHTFDLGLREYVLEEWENVGSQLQLSERRAIPLVVGSVLGSPGVARSRKPESLLSECLRWKRENEKQVLTIREATREFEALDDESRRQKASAYVAELLKSPSTRAARNRALGERLSVRDGWLGLAIRTVLNPVGALTSLVADSTDKVRLHFQQTSSREYTTATHLSEAARPILAGVGPEVRQCLIDIFGGTVVDARNPKYDPDRFPASA